MAANPLLAISRTLSETLAGLTFDVPVTHVYDPLQYAWPIWQAYVEAYATGPKRVVIVGMNPGPYGMTQTGVPFGEISYARDFMGLAGPVGQPPLAHPKRPVTGFACPRSEVSGSRFWGAVEAHFGTMQAFSREHVVLNYCPLVFMEASGRNRTPNQLLLAERTPLYAACDAALRQAIEALSPEWVLGVGTFAEGRAAKALAGLDVKLGRISHPSPASPAANRGWDALVTGELKALGLC